MVGTAEKKPRNSSLLDAWSLFRAPNLIMVALLMLLIRWTVLHPFFACIGIDLEFSSVSFALFVLDMLLVTLAGYWINDFFDFDIDHSNGCQKYWGGNSVSRGFYRNGFWFLTVLSALLSLYLAMDANKLFWIWIHPVSVGLLFVYAYRLKGLPVIGNVVVSAFIAVVPWVVLLSEAQLLEFTVEEQLAELTNTLYLFSLFAFGMNLSRELVKDCEDLEGDELMGLNTLPAIFGVTIAVRSAAVVLVLLAAAALAFVLSPSLIAPEWIVILSGIPIAGALAMFLIDPKSRTQFKAVSLVLKVMMVLGMIALFVLPEAC